MTRREVLEAVGRVGGASALSAALSELGWAAGGVPTPDTTRSAFRLDGEPGRGVNVLILGAGLAGLCAAYELTRAGYDCRVLEARGRPGGRCFTVRRGTSEEETGGVRQTCRFDDGHYLNAGPARIPQHHVTLDYCRELGVAIEPFCQTNEAAYYCVSRPDGTLLGGGPVRAREVHSDLLGYASELLAKALNRGALDAEATPEDRRALGQLLRDLGELGGDGVYRGGQGRGRPRATDGEAVSGRTGEPLKLSELLRSVPREPWIEERELPRQPMLFQVVGGMDNLAKALANRIGDPRVTYDAPVREILPSPERVRVVYGPADRPRVAEADYCISTLPVPVLKNLAGGLSPRVRAALAGAGYGTAGKVGLQFGRRFWEEDDRIYGGITRTDPPCLQIWYPSHGFFARKGVLVGYYTFDGMARALGESSPEQRVARALEQGERVHGRPYRDDFECAYSVAWERLPYSLGAWGQEDVPALREPDGRVFFASADLTALNGWMAGAFESARAATRAVHLRAQQNERKRPAAKETGGRA